MAFSCKMRIISRCLELKVSAPPLGGFALLLVWLSVELKIISPRTYLAFVFLSIMFHLSVMFVGADVASSVHSFEALETGQVGKERLGRILLRGCMHNRHKHIGTQGQTSVPTQ